MSNVEKEALCAMTTVQLKEIYLSQDAVRRDQRDSSSSDQESDIDPESLLPVTKKSSVTAMVRPFSWSIPDMNKMELLSRLASFRNKIMVFEGRIAVGKTTTCMALGRLFALAGIPRNVFKEEPGKKALQLFLKDKKAGANAFQVMLCGNRILSYQKATFSSVQGNAGIMDRSLDGDHAFALMHHKKGNISDEQYAVYLENIENNSQYFIRPHVIVYLRASIKKSIERIETRGTPGEKEAYTPEYLKELDDNYNACLLDPITRFAEEESVNAAYGSKNNLKEYWVEEDDEDLVMFANEDIPIPSMEPEWKVAEAFRRQQEVRGKVLKRFISDAAYKKTANKLMDMISL